MICPEDRYIRRVERDQNGQYNARQTGRSGCAEPLPLGASLVEVGEPERTYQPGRYMEEKEGYTCMGEDREAGQLEVESLEGGRGQSGKEDQEERLVEQRLPEQQGLGESYEDDLVRRRKKQTTLFRANHIILFLKQKIYINK